MNPLMARAAALRADGLTVLDLSDTNFHNHGLRYPDSRLKSYLGNYVDMRRYRSDSRGMYITRERLREWYTREGDPIDAERVILTASTSESYSLVFQSLLSAGDRVLLPAPTYPLFEQLCQYSRLEPVYYRLQPETGFTPDFTDVVAGLESGARAVVVISPNNPTGSVLSQAELSRFDRLAASYGAFVVSDEVFAGTERQKVGSGQRSAPARQEAGIASGNASGGPQAGTFAGSAPTGQQAAWFRFGGVSKLFASPDLKLAWIIASNVAEHRFDALELAADTFLNASAPSQYVAGRMLEEGRDVAQRIRESLISRAAAADSVLHRIAGSYGALALRCFPQSGGVHRVVQIPGVDDEKFAIDLLERELLLLHPGYFYGFPDDGYFVFSTVSSEDLLTEGLGRLGRFLNTLQEGTIP